MSIHVSQLPSVWTDVCLYAANKVSFPKISLEEWWSSLLKWKESAVISKEQACHLERAWAHFFEDATLDRLAFLKLIWSVLQRKIGLKEFRDVVDLNEETLISLIRHKKRVKSEDALLTAVLIGCVYTKRLEFATLLVEDFDVKINYEDFHINHFAILCHWDQCIPYLDLFLKNGTTITPDEIHASLLVAFDTSVLIHLLAKHGFRLNDHRWRRRLYGWNDSANFLHELIRHGYVQNKPDEDVGSIDVAHLPVSLVDRLVMYGFRTQFSSSKPQEPHYFHKLTEICLKNLILFGRFRNVDCFRRYPLPADLISMLKEEVFADSRMILMLADWYHEIDLAPPGPNKLGHGKMFTVILPSGMIEKKLKKKYLRKFYVQQC